MAMALANEGLDVVTAENGKDAIEKIEKIEGVCIILLDLMMPVMDGMEFLQWKATQSRLESWPVVILSASSRKEVPSGATAYLAKPINLDVLLDVLEKHGCSA